MTYNRAKPIDTTTAIRRAALLAYMPPRYLCQGALQAEPRDLDPYRTEVNARARILENVVVLTPAFKDNDDPVHLIGNAVQQEEAFGRITALPLDLLERYARRAIRLRAVEGRTLLPDDIPSGSVREMEYGSILSAASHMRLRGLGLPRGFVNLPDIYEDTAFVELWQEIEAAEDDEAVAKYAMEIVRGRESQALRIIVALNGDSFPGMLDLAPAWMLALSGGGDTYLRTNPIRHTTGETGER